MSPKKKKKKLKFPKMLYGTIDPVEGYVLTSETLDGVDAEDGDSVGVYELTAVKRIRLNAPDLD